MIRDYQLGDLCLFDGNEFVDWEKLYNGINDRRFKTAILDDGSVKAILVYWNKDKELAGFFSIAKDFSRANCRELKKEMHKLADKLGVEVLRTATPKDSPVERWHKFLGLSVERQLNIAGQICNVWSKVWAQKS